MGYFHNGCLRLGGGGGAEEQPLQLALQTRTCSAESGSQSKLEREPRRQGPQPQPACCPPLACCLAFQIRSKGTPLSYLPPAPSYDYLGAFGEGRSGRAQAPPSLDEGLPCQPSPYLIEKEQGVPGGPTKPGQNLKWLIGYIATLISSSTGLPVHMCVLVLFGQNHFTEKIW